MTKPATEIPSPQSHDSVELIPVTQQLLDTNTMGIYENKDFKKRPRLPRVVKSIQAMESGLPIPAGRKVHILHEGTYVADSTINDETEGIDAGWGLFAGRDFDPDSPYPDSDLVAYYEGAQMTEADLEGLLLHPTQGRTTGYILCFQGIVVDGWDHSNNRYAGIASAINDFLDERNNCQVSKELVSDPHKRKKGTMKLAIRTKTFAAQHTELGFDVPANLLNGHRLRSCWLQP